MRVPIIGGFIRYHPATEYGPDWFMVHWQSERNPAAATCLHYREVVPADIWTDPELRDQYWGAVIRRLAVSLAGLGRPPDSFIVERRDRSAVDAFMVSCARTLVINRGWHIGPSALKKLRDTRYEPGL